MLQTELPAERTPFVGRAAELSFIGRLFEQGSRLVTIFAPSGFGKTRLALRFCTQAARAETRAILYADVSSAKTSDDVVGVVAGVLSIAIRAGATQRDAAAQVGQALRARGSVLLAVDGFQHVVHLSAAAVGRWLDVAPELRILATSGQPLRLDGEACLELDPLDQDSATQLFLQRARSALGSDRRLDPALVRRAIERLDRIPLALELAAAQLGGVPMKALLARLESSGALDLLRSSRGEAAPRYAAILAALDGSWETLTSTERAVLRRAAVFAGEFSPRAAQAVLFDDGPADEVLRTLLSLRDKSMLRRTDLDDAAEPRFALFELARSYVREKFVTSPEAASIAERHRRDTFARAESSTEADDHRTLAAELRLVFERCERDAPSDAAHAVLLFDRAPIPHRASDEHLSLLERAARALQHSHESSARLRIECARGDCERLRGEFGAARARLSDALEASNEPSLRAALLLALAELELDSGNPEQAMVYAELARELAPHEGTSVASAELFAAWACFDRGDLVATEERCRRAIACRSGAAPSRLLAQFHLFLALALLRKGRRVEARIEFVQARELAQHARDAFLECFIINGSADLAMAEQDWLRAEAQIREGLELARCMGYGLAEAASQTKLGLLQLDLGHLEQARESFEAALAFHRSNADSLKAAIVDHLLALVALDEERFEQAEGPLRAMIANARQHGHKLAEGLAQTHLVIALAKSGRCDEARSVNSELMRLQGLEDDASFQECARIAGASLAWPSVESAKVLFPERHALASALVRITRRVAARGLSRRPGGMTSRTRLVLGPEARWFRVDARPVVDLSRRGGVRRILLALARGAARAPELALTVASLIDAGWPNEKVGYESGVRRVYTSMGLLRDLGLRGLIESRDDGYSIASATDVVLEADVRAVT